MERCTNCRSYDTMHDPERGETCCRTCGVVLADRIGVDGGPTDASTPVMPGTRPTTMGPIPAENHADNIRLAKRDGWVGADRVPSALRSGSLSRMHSVCEKAGLPHAAHTRAIEIYTMAATAGLTTGRTLMSVMAASAYLACRELGVPRTIRNIAAACDLSRRRLSRDVSRIMEYGDLKPQQYDMRMLITRLASTVGAGAAAVRAAADVVGRLDDTYAGGKDPTILAAAMLHMAMCSVGEGGSARTLARAAGVCDASVRMRYNDMLEMGLAPPSVEGSLAKPVE